MARPSMGGRANLCLAHLALNLHYPSLRAKRGNPDSGAAGLPRFARKDDSFLLHCALAQTIKRLEAK